MGREEIKAYLMVRPTEWYLEERKRKSIEGVEGRTDRDIEKYIEKGAVRRPAPRIKKPRGEANNLMQGFSEDNSKGKSSQYLTATFSISREQLQLAAPVAVKSREKRKRLPSACNLFMTEEIQRVKATYPHMLHREAFKLAAKNWAEYVRPAGSTPANNKNGNKPSSYHNDDVGNDTDARAVLAAEVNLGEAGSCSDDDEDEDCNTQSQDLFIK